MAETIQNGQTCLEKRGIEERSEEIVRSDYNAENPYGPTHVDALAENDDPQGKGTGSGGHTHWLPSCDKPSNMINYSNFDTSPDMKIGGIYDREGRNDVGGREKAMASSKYTYQSQYGANLVNTSENVALGQYRVGDTIKNM